MVTSKPKRISVAAGVVHIIILLKNSLRKTHLVNSLWVQTMDTVYNAAEYLTYG